MATEERKALTNARMGAAPRARQGHAVAPHLDHPASRVRLMPGTIHIIGAPEPDPRMVAPRDVAAAVRSAWAKADVFVTALPKLRVRRCTARTHENADRESGARGLA